MTPQRNKSKKKHKNSNSRQTKNFIHTNLVYLSHLNNVKQFKTNKNCLKTTNSFLNTNSLFVEKISIPTFRFIDSCKDSQREKEKKER